MIAGSGCGAAGGVLIMEVSKYTKETRTAEELAAMILEECRWLSRTRG